MTELAAVPSTGRPAAEAEALERLYDRHARRIFGFCLHQLRKRDEAEDAVQMTFMYALGALRRGVVPAAESAWLLKIARNVCLSRFDAVRRRSNVEQPSDPLALAETAPASMPDADAPNLREALARLPERQCRAIVMREWQGLSYAEIATELGIGTAAVETLIFRARQSLARELRGEERDTKRRAFDLWSLLSWAKSFLGGGAAKIAVGAAVVASVGAAASVPLVHSSPGAKEPPPVRTRAAVVHAVAPAAPARPAAPRPAAPKPVRQRAVRLVHAGHVPVPSAPVEAPVVEAPVVEAPVAEAPKGADESPAPTSAAPPPPAPAASSTAAPAAPEEAPAPTATAPPSVPATPVDAPSLPPVQAPTLPVSAPALPAPPPVQTPTLPSVPSVPDVPSLPTLP